MIKLDNNLLEELGLGALEYEDKKKMLAHIYETLEMRVGTELAQQMSDDQLIDFEQFIKQNDESGALDWLGVNFPDYPDVVASEFEKLKVEIKQAAPQIVASSQSSAPVSQDDQQDSVPPQS
jgi:predicted RNA-binding Zn ribbon-like protein